MLVSSWDDYSEILNKFGAYYVAQLKSDLMSEGHHATGKLANSIYYKLENKQTLVVGSTYTNELGVLGLSEGRKISDKTPSRPMIEHIKLWMKAKNIRRRYGEGSFRGGRFRKRSTESDITAGAFAMARGILRKGYEGSGTIERSYNKIKDKIDKELLESLSLKIDEQLKNIIIK